MDTTKRSLKLWFRSKDFMCVLEAIWKSQLSMLEAMASSCNGVETVINLLNSSPVQSFSCGDRFSFGNRFCLARSRVLTLVAMAGTTHARPHQQYGSGSFFFFLLCRLVSAASCESWTQPTLTKWLWRCSQLRLFYVQRRR